MSPEVQNRGISGPKKGLMSSKFFLKSLEIYCTIRFYKHILSATIEGIYHVEIRTPRSTLLHVEIEIPPAPDAWLIRQILNTFLSPLMVSGSCH